jgi:SAM-dependent methyltransferase
MIPALVKRVLPDRPVPMRIWRGPFRGARVMMNPRQSLRKALGIYEHELNPWLEAALRRVSRVLDVGANDGYFTFGCAAAFRRQNRPAEIVAFEPQMRHVDALRAAAARQASNGVRIDIFHTFVGASDGDGDGVTTLDAIATADRRDTLIKVDVEGAEADVVRGAASWLDPSNLFLIEVHRRPLIDELRAAFASRGLDLELIEQQPLPLLGREVRDADNWWLVSKLDPQ